jgi:hypothetical protein
VVIFPILCTRRLGCSEKFDDSKLCNLKLEFSAPGTTDYWGSVGRQENFMKYVSVQIFLNDSNVGAQILLARSPGWILFVWWHIFVGPQYRTSFMSPFWCLEFWGGCEIKIAFIGSWNKSEFSLMFTAIQFRIFSMLVFKTNFICCLVWVWNVISYCMGRPGPSEINC